MTGDIPAEGKTQTGWRGVPGGADTPMYRNDPAQERTMSEKRLYRVAMFDRRTRRWFWIGMNIPRLDQFQVWEDFAAADEAMESYYQQHSNASEGRVIPSDASGTFTLPDAPPEVAGMPHPFDENLLRPGTCNECGMARGAHAAPPAPSPLSLRQRLAAALTIEGKSPWDFCCEWYRVDEIERHVKAPHCEIPDDISSSEFAEWMTHQYRLAMKKGMELAYGSLDRLSILAALDELERLRNENARLQKRNRTISEENRVSGNWIRSFSAMLGWLNVPPQSTMEMEMSALKARTKSTEAELATANARLGESELESERLEAVLQELATYEDPHDHNQDACVVEMAKIARNAIS